jgi:hypothetical protein
VGVVNPDEWLRRATHVGNGQSRALGRVIVDGSGRICASAVRVDHPVTIAGDRETLVGSDLGKAENHRTKIWKRHNFTHRSLQHFWGFYYELRRTLIGRKIDTAVAPGPHLGHINNADRPYRTIGRLVTNHLDIYRVTGTHGAQCGRRAGKHVAPGKWA